MVFKHPPVPTERNKQGRRRGSLACRVFILLSFQQGCSGCEQVSAPRFS